MNLTEACFYGDKLEVAGSMGGRMGRTWDLAGQSLIASVLIIAALPWLGGTPSDIMVWSFAVAPPIILLGLLTVRDRLQLASTRRD